MDVFLLLPLIILLYKGGIELREPLLSSKRSVEAVSSHSSTKIATENQQKANLKLEISDKLENGKPSQENNDTQLPKNYQFHNRRREDESRKKDITSDDDTNHHIVQNIGNSSDNSVQKQLPLGLELKKISSISVCNDQEIAVKSVPETNPKPKEALNSGDKMETSTTSPDNTLSNKKTNATTETPPKQLVVTFTNDTIACCRSEERSNGTRSGQRVNCQEHPLSMEMSSSDDKVGINECVEDRKSSSEGSQSCCCDDSCNNGCILNQERTTSNLSSGKSTPRCFHSNGNSIAKLSSVSGKYSTGNESNSPQHFVNGNNKNSKVAVATQTTSVSASLSSSAGTPGSNEEGQTSEGATQDRTLTACIGDQYKGMNESSYIKSQLNERKFKNTHMDEPLSLMQEVPDVVI